MSKSHPYWLIPNLISLDAPIVALVWAWIFSETWRVQWVDQKVFYVLPSIVWMIYILDRFIDNHTSKGERAKFSSRHAYHHEHWGKLKLLLFSLGGFSAAMILMLPKGIFWHVIPIIVLVCVYFFIALFEGQGSARSNLFKNTIAGYTFSYGVAMGIYFFRPSVYSIELIWNKEMFLFGVLCICNITAIDFWEASRASKEREIKGYYEFMLTVPLFLLVTGSLCLAVVGDNYARPFYITVMLSAGLLQLVNRYRSRFSLDALRALDDAALIAPAPVFWLYMHYQG